MEIIFTSSSNQKLFSSEKKLEKKFGCEMAFRIMSVLTALNMVDNLADFKQVKRRCHELTGDYKGKLAIDLVHPYRLIIEPNPRVVKSDGGLDWSKTRSVSIVDVVDYH